MILLIADNVAFRYPQQTESPPAHSLRVSEGDFLLVTGDSGAGKSTLMRCLAGLIPHLYNGEMRGEVWIDGLQTVSTPLWQLAEKAGLVFQNPATQMLTFTVEDEIIFGLENLGLPRVEITQRLESVLTRFNLHTMRRRNPQSLSGGEQQRLALAAIVARQPRVLLLDEPLSMLDTTAVAEFVAYLAAIAAAGTTVIVSEHRTAALTHVPNVQKLHINGNGTPPQIPTPELNTAPAHGSLCVRNLTVRYGQRTVLDKLALTVAAGETVAIVGRNGVGKTTLLRCIAGLQEHDGAIKVEEDAAAFGIVFQNADLQLFNPTVREEILYRLPDADQTRYEWLLDLFNLRRYEEKPPLLLSEGEKKRVALAGIVMQLPRDGLLLDEPTLGQDAGHKRQLAALIRTLGQAGKMVLFTTHDLDLAAQADRIVLLGTRGIVADGTPAEVFANREAWDEIGLLIPTWLNVHEIIEKKTDNADSWRDIAGEFATSAD